jgi:hypoxanthine phosphoribosyltransferase
MLDKPSRREVPYTPDYIGAEIPDKFVVGFGLDYDEKYRNLPYVGVLRPEIYGRNHTNVNAINEREPDKK